MVFDRYSFFIFLIFVVVSFIIASHSANQRGTVLGVQTLPDNPAQLFFIFIFILFSRGTDPYSEGR